MRPVRRNLSRRQQRLQDSARQIVIRSPVPLSAEERHAAEQKSAEGRAHWQREYDKRTAAAKLVIKRAMWRTLAATYKPIVANPYRCGKCGAERRKLWREYQSFSPSLLCGPCALADQKKSGPIDRDGMRESEYGCTDQIGWLVPAVPDEEGHGFWGYTSIPDAGVAWWKVLPS